MDFKQHKSPMTVTLLIALTLLGMLGACNENVNSIEENEYIRGSELIVSKFYLQANSKVMSHLDSVYFAIDLEQGIIFNADSLPMGTPINKLIPVISVPSTVERVEIAMENEDGTRTVIDYNENPSDTIDFTKKVTLELATLNESATRTYQLKVNVHKMNPDSLRFDLEGRMALPSRLNAPQSQKTVTRDSVIYSFITEADGSYTLSHTKSIVAGNWTKQQVNPGFTPRIESFTASDGKFFMLDSDGYLHNSAEGLDWQKTDAPRWESVIGDFGGILLGVRNDGNTLVHTRYPLGSYTETPIDDNFPYLESTTMSIYSTKWSSLPLGLITGGQTRNGLTGATWAFDGTTWCQISERPIPAAKGGTLIPYYAYLKSTTLWRFNEYSIWMYFGGMLADGSVNRTVYVTFDNGVHWQEASESMQLPESITALYHIGHAVIDTPLEANFSPATWEDMGKLLRPQRKLPYVINGYEIYWNCPYIYLIGGQTSADSKVNPWIYRGVINRMSFQPLI